MKGDQENHIIYYFVNKLSFKANLILSVVNESFLCLELLKFKNDYYSTHTYKMKMKHIYFYNPSNSISLYVRSSDYYIQPVASDERLYIHF